MKFWRIFKFEIGYQFHRKTTWVYFAVVLFLSCLSTYGMMQLLSERETLLNAPVIHATLTALVSMFTMLMISAVSSNTVLRDQMERMDSLIFTTSIRKSTLLGSRFLCVFFINVAGLTVISMVLIMINFVPLDMDDIIGPWDLTSNIFSFLVISIPNAFIVSAILFSSVLLSRYAIMTYLSALILFFLVFINQQVIAGEWGMWGIGAHMDPLGLTALKEIQLSFTPIEINTHQILPKGQLLSNRILWLTISTFFLLLGYWRFRFNYRSQEVRNPRQGKNYEMTEGIISTDFNKIILPKDTRIFGYKTHIKQVLILALDSFKILLSEKKWLVLVVAAAVFFVNGREMLQGEMDLPGIPVTIKVINLFSHWVMVSIIAFLTVYYSGELVWRERDGRMSDIVFSTPVPNWIMLVSKYLGIALMLILFQLLLLVSGILFQASEGYFNFDIGLYLKVFFGFQLVDYLLFALVALIIQIAINQKYLGYLLVFITYYYMYSSQELGIEHKLLVFGSDPGWGYSEMSGFDPHIGPWIWFKTYWLLWIVFIAIIANFLLVRGREQDFKTRLSQVQKIRSGMMLPIMGTILIFILLFGGFLFYNTNILHTYLTAGQFEEQKVMYEKKYAKFAKTAQPIISNIELNVEIYPSSYKVEIEGRYQLENNTNVSIDTIHLSPEFGITSNMKVDRAAKLVLEDNVLQHHILVLEKALFPGESLGITFNLNIGNKGFSNWGKSSSVVQNGTYLHSEDIMPKIGYQRSRELKSNSARKKNGLKPRLDVPSIYNREALANTAGEDPIQFSATVGTSSDQQAITTGRLIEKWEKDGRNYFRYSTDAPIRNGFPIFSANYAQRNEQWQDVKIEIFHHPGHGRNVDRMMNSVVASLKHYSEIFGPYPHKEIKLVENPGDGLSLRANPIAISFSEDFSFYAPEKEFRGFDFPFAVVAHEVAHQWWGNMVVPAHVEGGPVLSESLSWYSAMLVVEKTFGTHHLEQLLWIMKHKNLTPRSAADVPLMRSTDWFNAYRKGPFAMYTLKEYLGDTTINSALKQLVKKHGIGHPPMPTTLDLINELNQVTPDSLRYLINDLIVQNSFWEFKASSGNSKRLKNGIWEIQLELEAKKIAVDHRGVETKVPMADFVEIGIYGDLIDSQPRATLYKKMHRLSSGRQVVTIQLEKQPYLARIDPRDLLLDRDREDNSLEIINPD